MNGLMNIQVRVQSREAQALLKQFQKEVAAVDRAIQRNGQATGRLAAFQQNLKNQTKALAAAERELAAAQRAGTSAANANAAATAAIAGKQTAATKATQALAAAEAKRNALLPGSIRAQAAAAMNTERLTAARERLQIADINLGAAERALAQAQARFLANPSEAAGEAVIRARERLTKANIAADRSLRGLMAAESTSVQSQAKAAAAADRLAAAQRAVQAAQDRVAATSAALSAAQQRVGATQAEMAAAARRAAAAQNQLAAAQERAAAAAAAATAAQGRASAASTAAGAAAGALAAGGLAKAIKGFRQMSNTAQWAGRSLQTNFTLPIMIAGGFAVKWALDNEKAMTKLEKVYGDGSQSVETYAAETEALGVSMRLLSEQFGVQQDEVIGIGAAWAAAGAEGVALAKGVQQTLRTMVVGELEAEEATKALISIQAQWGESSEGLAKTMNMLNTVENQTGVSLKDLVDGYARASGAARFAGVTQRELAADIAALVPAAGSAASAGNGLKTIYSRLMSPTSDAVAIFEKLGIEMDSQNWKSTTASQKLQTLADKYKTLDTAQRAQVGAIIAGRWQLTRYEVLLDAIGKKEGYREKALRATADAETNRKIADQELQKVMESNPQKLKQLGVVMQNVAADLGTKLVPAVLAVASVLASLFRWFNNLDPAIRKFVAGLLIFLAVVGPIIRLVGALGTLIGWLGTIFLTLVGAAAKTGMMVFRLLALPFMALSKVLMIFRGVVIGTIAITRAIPAAFIAARGAVIAFFVAFRTMAALTSVWAVLLGIAGAGMKGLLLILRTGLARAALLLIGWPGLIIAAVVTALVLFKDQIAQTFSGVVKAFQENSEFFSKIGDGIVKVFNKLPQGIQNAMIAVIRIVRDAVLAVYELFSYLNPFAKHSPSLVDNVKNGMAVIQSEFAKLPAIGAPINKAYADIKRFKDLTRDMMQGLDSMKRLEDLKMVQKYAPQAAGAFKVLVKDLQVMQPILDQLEAAMNRQQKVVDSWKTKVDAANDKLQAEKDILDSLEEKASKWADKLNEAQARLDDFASTPIAGMRAMEDAIFDNEMAQKRLQLQMMDMEDAVGPIDDLENRMASLNGAIETLKGTQTDLRNAGAGSEVLSVYDEQISALEAQQGQIEETASEYDALKAQLEELGRIGERLDLTKSLNFDGLNRQIDQAANSMTELPFDEIMAGVQGAKADIDKYGAGLDAANKKVDEQKAVVDKAQAAYDALNKQYEAEQKHLDAITEKYNKMRDAIGDVKEALDSVTQAASEAASSSKAGGKGSAAEQAFDAAAGGNFPIQGGKKGIGREGGLPEIEDFNKKIADEMKGLTDSLDMFAPIKEKWNEFTGWWKKNVSPSVGPLLDDLGKAFTDVNWGAPFKNAEGESTKFMKGVEKAGSVFATVGQAIWDVVQLFLPDLKELAEQIISKIIKAFQTWWPEIQKLIPAVMRLAQLIGMILAPFIVALLAVIKVLATIFVEVLGRALDFVIDIIGDLLRILTGLIDFVVGVLTGDWALAWEGIKNVVIGIFEAIWHVIEGFVSIIWGVIKGFVEGIVEFFVWLWDVLVGHSIIPDLCNAIFDWFKKLPGRILSALAALGEKLVELIKAAWALFMEALRVAWKGTWEFIKGLPQKIYDGFMLGVDVITSIGSKIIGWIKSGLSSAWENVKTWIGEKVDWVVSKFGGIKNSLLGKFSGMFDGIKDAFRGAINFIIDAWNGLEFKIPGFDPPGPGPKFGGFTLGVPDLPRLAKGGIAHAGFPHIIGEVGPELFVPGQSGRVFSNANLQDLVNAATGEALSRLNGVTVATAMRSTASGQLGAAADAADRRVSMASTPAAPVQSATVTNNTEYHFHGDLSFPNIKSGEDAEQFLTNLNDLAG